MSSEKDFFFEWSDECTFTVILLCVLNYLIGSKLRPQLPLWTRECEKGLEADGLQKLYDYNSPHEVEETILKICETVTKTIDMVHSTWEAVNLID